MRGLELAWVPDARACTTDEIRSLQEEATAAATAIKPRALQPRSLAAIVRSSPCNPQEVLDGVLGFPLERFEVSAVDSIPQRRHLDRRAAASSGFRPRDRGKLLAWRATAIQVADYDRQHVFRGRPRIAASTAWFEGVPPHRIEMLRKSPRKLPFNCSPVETASPRTRLVNHFLKEEVEENRRKEAEKKRQQRKPREAAARDHSDAEVPPGQPGESLPRPRSGRGGEGDGRVGDGLSSDESDSDPWAVRPEERLAPEELAAERQRGAQ